MQDRLRRGARAVLARYPRIFFCHVPKCAGVSLSLAIYASIYPRAFKFTNLSTRIDIRSSQVSAELLDVDLMTAREVQLIASLNAEHTLFTTGHCIARPAVVRTFADRWDFVTVLRDPVERFLSEYVYNRFKTSDWYKPNDEFEAYLDTENAAGNAVTYARYFSGRPSPAQVQAEPDAAVRDAIANLERFSVVGTLEDMAGWQAAFQDRFGRRLKINRRNTSPNTDAVDRIRENAAAMERVREMCAIDRAIYDAVAARNPGTRS